MDVDSSFFETVYQGEGSVLKTQLLREVSPHHALFRHLDRIRVVGRARGNDDVLVNISNSEWPFAIVHLAWQETVQPPYPWTEFYRNLAAAEAAMRDDPST